MLTSKPVCYGARDDNPAIVKTKRKGFIKSIKLQHVSGQLECSIGNSFTYWGCEVYNPDQLLTVLTNSANSILFPPVGNYTLGVSLTYTLKGYNHLSKELIIPAQKPVMINQNEILKIWFVEDLVKHKFGDNSGKHCVHVFAIYA